MDVVRFAVGSAVVALLAGHQLSMIGPERRTVLWTSARTILGAAAAPPPAAAGAPPRSVPRVVPAGVPTMPHGEETVAPDEFGQFQTAIEIGGQRLSAMVDTGASFVSLSFEDADRLGLRPMPSDFKYAVSTANGHAAVAKVQLPSVRLGSIELHDVPALVSGRGQLGQSLLGMSFLSRLSSVRMERGRLVLSR